VADYNQQQQTADNSANYMAFQPPQQQANVGLNAQFVYGENLQAALGISEQVALGSAIQLVINPMALAEACSSVVPPAVQAVCGGGSGGYMQFTIGTNSTVNVGRVYSITLGKKVEIDLGDPAKVPTAAKAAEIIVGVLISAALLGWMIAYNQYGDDEDSRAEACLVSQTILNGLMSLFVTIAASFDSVDKNFWAAQAEVFQVKGSRLRKAGATVLNVASASIAAGIGLEGLILPAIQSSKDESHWLSNAEQDAAEPFIDPGQVWGKS
jgi:hypothetical protein